MIDGVFRVEGNTGQDKFPACVFIWAQIQNGDTVNNAGNQQRAANVLFWNPFFIISIEENQKDV